MHLKLGLFIRNVVQFMVKQCEIRFTSSSNIIILLERVQKCIKYLLGVQGIEKVGNH